MKYCTHCGASLPDNAKFCTACGTPVSKPARPRATTTQQGGIVIDAPEGSTVTISDRPPGTAPGRKGPQGTETRVPDTQGEVELSAWDDFVPDGQYTVPKGPAARKPASGSRSRTSAPSAPKESPKKGKGIGKRILKFIFWLLVISIVLSLIGNYI